jgi:hypothetical protein
MEPGKTLQRTFLIVVPLVLLVVWMLTGRGDSVDRLDPPEAIVPRAPAELAADSKTPAPQVRQTMPAASLRDSRPVRLRFLCGMLGSVRSRAVWEYMKLEVRIQAESGAEIATVSTPWEPAIVRIPSGLDHLTVHAPGYLRRPVDLANGKRAKDGSFLITLTPDASVHVSARSLPVSGGLRVGEPHRFVIGVALPVGAGRKTRFQVFAPSQVVARADAAAELHLRVRVPSGIPLQAFLRSTRRGRENLAGLASQVRELAPLQPAEIGECVFDLDDCPVLRGRVVGLPRGTARHQSVSVRELDPPRLACSAPLGENGEFLVRGLSGRPVEIRLAVRGGRSPLLRTVGRHESSLVPEDGLSSVLESPSPLVGVIPVEKGKIVDRPFAVGVWRESERRLHSRIPLFTPDWLEHGVVHVRVRDTGSFTCQLRGRQPGADGLIRVPVPAPGGEVVVGSGQSLPKPWRFALERALSDGRSDWIHPDATSARQRVFRGVPVGEYRLRIAYGAGQHLNLASKVADRPVVVRSRQRTTVDVPLPAVIEVRAEVQGHEPWVEEFGELHLRIDHGDASRFRDVSTDGTFSILTFEGWRGPDRVRIGNKRLHPPVTVRDVRWDPSQRLLLIRCPKRRESNVIESKSIANGGLWLRVYRPRGTRASGGADVLPSRAGHFELQPSEAPLDVMLMENAREASGTSLKIVRGWLRLSPGEPRRRSFAPSGRWVTVRRRSKGTSEVQVLAPSWWRQAEYTWARRRITGTVSQRVWLPAAARGMRLDGRDIAAANIDRELVLD